MKTRPPYLKVGDMVVVIDTAITGIPLHDAWYSDTVYPPKKGWFLPGQIGLVIETLESAGGNACRVLVVGGEKTKVGWSNVNYLLAI